MKLLVKARSVRPAFADFQAKFLKIGLTKEAIQKAYAETDPDKGACFMNDLYVVKLHDLGNGCNYLLIQRIDFEPCRDWRHFQQIKNQLCGEEREAVELYPAESRLIDAGNTYHLWVLPEGDTAPFGFREGRHVKNAERARSQEFSVALARQRG